MLIKTKAKLCSWASLLVGAAGLAFAIGFGSVWSVAFSAFLYGASVPLAISVLRGPWRESIGAEPSEPQTPESDAARNEAGPMRFDREG